MRMICEKCDVRFYHRNVLINSQAIKVALLEKGALDVLAKEYLAMPMFQGKRLNAQVIPIKKDVMDLGFRNNEILVEVC